LEPPSRLTLGGWPDERTKIKGALSGLTLWDVPVFALDRIGDSAAAIYWAARELVPGGKRSVGFTYGLGVFTANTQGTLGFFVAGEPRVGGELVVAALVKAPEVGEKVTLKPVPAFEVVGTPTEQTVSFPPVGKYPFAPVTWKLRPTQAGKLSLRVDTGSGASHEMPVEIRAKEE
jgi:hypothetical protein